MSPQTVFVSPSVQFIGAGDVEQMSVVNLGEFTVYYYNQQSVSATLNSGSIPAGDDATITAGQWFVAGGMTQCRVSPVDATPVQADLIAAIAARQSLTEKGTALGYAGLDATGKVPSAQLPPVVADRPVVAAFSVPGDLAVGAGLARFYLPTAATIQSIEASLGGACTGQSVWIDVNRNGTTLYTTQSARPNIAAAGHVSGPTVPAVTAVALGDYLTVDVDQVGTDVGDTCTHVGTEAYNGSDGTTVSITRHGAAATGDIEIVQISTATGTGTWSSSGWTQIGTQQSSGAERCQWFYRVDNAAAGPWTFTCSASATGIQVLSTTYRGQNATPIDSSLLEVHTAVSPWTVAALTTVNPNVTEIFMVHLGASLALSTPSGYLQRLGFTGGGNLQRHLADDDHGLAGVQAGFSLTLALISDSFTDTTNTVLNAHVGELAAQWTLHPSSGAGTIGVRSSGRIDAQNFNTNTQLYYASGIPASADYDVEADVFLPTGALSTSHGGVSGRLDPTALTQYFAEWDNAAAMWRLYSQVNGAAAVLLGSSATSPPTTTATRLILRMLGTSIKVNVGGTDLISVTNSAVTAAGGAGVRTSGVTYDPALPGYVGVQLDNFRVVAPPTAGFSLRLGLHADEDELEPGSDLTVITRYIEA